MGLPSLSNLACCSSSLALRRALPPWGTLPRLRRCLRGANASPVWLVGLSFIRHLVAQNHDEIKPFTLPAWAAGEDGAEAISDLRRFSGWHKLAGVAYIPTGEWNRCLQAQSARPSG